MLLIRPLLRANDWRAAQARTCSCSSSSSCRQHRRPADAAGRPAAVPRLPARRAVLLDAAACSPSTCSSSAHRARGVRRARHAR
ncbi:MAG: hypothetical protein MZV64_72910 [Ignavibacteriales bacterium]|nr:hypothetical protein [Ignavibacteriales bacterium]